jgi:tetratricopeptide (TPR) repeat protein
MYFDTAVKKEESVLVEAEECIQKIFSLNPDSSSGHYLRGMIQRKRRNLPQAVKELKRSLAIDPNHPDPLFWLGWVYAHSGRISEARLLAGRLLKVDPLNLLTYSLSGIVEVFDGKFDASTKEFDKALQLDEQNMFIRFWQARSLTYARRFEEARRLSDLIENESPGTIWAGLASFHRLALENKKVEALQIDSGDFKKQVRDDESFPIWMAESYALLRETTEAIERLENAVDWGFINYPFLMDYDPFLANIRNEPRFKKLMKRVKCEWEHFAE